jgi:hypothetical protein
MPAVAPVAPPGDGRERSEVVATSWLAVAVVATASASDQSSPWNGDQTRAAASTADVDEHIRRAAGDVPSLARFAVAPFAATAAWIATFRVSFSA